MNLHLARSQHHPQFTMGVLSVQTGEQSDIKFRTLEPPWKDNERRKSCIPAGRYKLRLRKVGRYCEIAGKRWNHEGSIEVEGVDGRSTILVHWGTFVKDTLGCILVALAGSGGVLKSSRAAYVKLYQLLIRQLRNDNVWLIITDDDGNEADTFDREAVEL